jgi:NADPH-dependent 7-cyano-7-deazaguanine reductase QueF-like protein
MLSVETVILNRNNQCIINAKRLKVFLNVLEQRFIHTVHIGTLVLIELSLELAGFAVGFVILRKAQTCDR